MSPKRECAGDRLTTKHRPAAQVSRRDRFSPISARFAIRGWLKADKDSRGLGCKKNGGVAMSCQARHSHPPASQITTSPIDALFDQLMNDALGAVGEHLSVVESKPDLLDLERLHAVAGKGNTRLSDGNIRRIAVEVHHAPVRVQFEHARIAERPPSR